MAGTESKGRKRVKKVSAPGSASTATHEAKAELPTSQQWLGSLLEMEGLGQEHWKGIDPDEFVRKLREGWG